MLTLQLSAKHMYILYVFYQDFYNILGDMYINCDTTAKRETTVGLTDTF